MGSSTAEYELLRRAARSCLSEGPDDSGDNCSHAQIDWNQALWLGREQGALLLLHHALRHDLQAIACPDEIRSQLDGLSAAAKLQSLARTAAICRLHDVLSRAGLLFFLVDGWMFQTCFHRNVAFIESVAPIRCLFPSEDLTRARAILSEAGFPPTASGVHIASRAQSPVECVAHLAAGVSGDVLFSRDSGSDGIGLPAGRLLRRLPNPEWLTLLAGPWRQRTTLPLYPAFQLALCASRMSGPQPVVHSAWVDEVIAASRATLDATSCRRAHHQPRNTDRGVVVPPACPFLPTPAPVIER
ncbi:MAG TPA: hypothetical protein VHE61_06820, partial [Opitutaceae bacterium]|nr:hypothetical protein [Opitutaceae bacterium]